MAKPVVYGPALSTYVRTTRMALVEKRVDYELIEVDLLSGGVQSPEHMARHPFAKVPAFEHDGQMIYETTAILAYIDRAFPGPALVPADPLLAARTVQIEGIVNSYLYGRAIGGVVFPLLVAPMLGKPADRAAADEALPGVRQAIVAIESLAADSGRLVTDERNAADLFLGPIFFYLEAAGVLDGVLTEAPKLRAWWANMAASGPMQATAPSFG